METVKISLNKPVYGSSDIPVYNIYETKDNLNVVVSDDTYARFTVGMTVYLKRYANRGGYTHLISDAFVVKGIKSRTLILDKPSENKLRITNHANFVDIQGNQIGVDLTFDKPHRVFLQDISQKNPKISLVAYDVDGEKIWEKSELYIRRQPRNIAELTDLYTYESGEGCDAGSVDVTYTYLPQSFYLDVIMISGVTESSLKLDNVDYLKFVVDSGYGVEDYNPYYYIDSEYKKPSADIDEERRWCVFWMDKSHGDDKLVSFTEKADYWNVPVSLHADTDWKIGDMSDENLFALADRVGAENVPGIINMERVKCVPIVNSRGSIATAITLNFHFRKRVEKERDNAGNITYEEGWHIDENSWWNGMEGDDIGEFMSLSGNVSDMLGYLDFEDNDVFYRKSALTKSFVRLSFYSSNEVMSHSLLTYNTVFFSAGDMYGSLLKQKVGRNDGIITAATDCVFTDIPLSSGRIDTHITISSEMDTTKSAEGFNIYLFQSDIPQNSIWTIYMKVEFNHAKFGKTIPFLLLSNGQKVNVENYLSTLYIPVHIRYINDRYTYFFPTAINNSVDKTITINLYEPRISDDD